MSAARRNRFILPTFLYQLLHAQQRCDLTQGATLAISTSRIYL